jgi:hypothetical protein
VPARVAEIEASAAATVVDLHVFGRERPTPIWNARGLDPGEDLAELRLAHLERVVADLDALVGVEIERGVSFTCTGAKWDCAPS